MLSETRLTKRERQKERRFEKAQARVEAEQKRKRRRNIYLLSISGIIAVIIFVAVLLAQQLGDDGDEDSTQSITTTTAATQTTNQEDNMPNYTTYTDEDYGQGECPPTEVPDPPTLEFSDSPALCLDLEKEYDAVFTTSEGIVRVRLDTQNTPGTANNFYALARYGYYNGTLLFRTDPSIGIIQGGAPHNNSPSDPGPGYTIKDEGTEFEYVPGQLVMARTAQPNSSSAQFFFAVNNEAARLDGQGTFVVFGQTIEGLDVLENILGLHQEDPGSQLGGGPSRDVVVESLEVVEVDGS